MTITGRDKRLEYARLKGVFMKREDIREWLVGPVCAVGTPFKEDFSPDYDTYRYNLRWMIEHGMKTGDGALLVAAGGGEHPSLNVEERKRYMAIAVEEADGRVPVISSIQHADIRIIIELAQYAESIGLDAAQLGPTYYYGNTAADYFRLFSTVAQEADVTLMAYYLTGIAARVPISTLEDIADIPTVGAIKWSAMDAPKFRRPLERLSKKVAIVNNGGDLAISHMNGSRAFTTQISNFWPEHATQLWRLMQAGDYVGLNAMTSGFNLEWREWVVKVGAETASEGAFIKAAMEAVGLGGGPPRPPSVRPSAGLLQEIEDLFRKYEVPKAS
jgi:dihydrodipicolinate synthase/N-acetylneuraminate lyase